VKRICMEIATGLVYDKREYFEHHIKWVGVT